MNDTSKAGAAKVAVILVAGIGERLRPITNDRPKALVPVGPETVLARAMRQLVAHGVQHIVLGTGYCQQAVREAVKHAPVPVTLCPNAAFDRTQNAVSLLMCEEAVGGRDFYKLDGDLLFRDEVLQRVDEHDAGLVAAVDMRAGLGEEEMKVRLEPGSCRIAAFGKQLEPEQAQGESIGIERLSAGAVPMLFDALRASYEAGETRLYYEDVYSRLLRGGLQAEAANVVDLPWAEVDTPEDLAQAEALVRAGKL